MSIYDFLQQRWNRVVESNQPKPKETYLAKVSRIIKSFPMDPVDADAWIKRMKGSHDLQAAFITNYTKRWAKSFYEWRLKPKFVFIYIIYGKLGRGKSILMAIIAKLAQEIYPKAEVRVIMTLEELLKAIRECPPHSIICFDEDMVAIGENSEKIKKMVKNKMKLLREKELNVVASYKTWTPNDLADGYFEMCGFNEVTQQTRTMFMDGNGAYQGLIFFEKNFDEAFYRPFELAKTAMSEYLQNTDGELSAFNIEQDDALIQQFFELLQIRGLFIRDTSKLTAFILNEASAQHLNISDLIIKRIAPRLSVKMEEYIASTKKGKPIVSVDPETVAIIADRIANDTTYCRVKSANSLRNYLRSYCSDLVKPDEINSLADLLYYKQKELHEKGLLQTQGTAQTAKGSEEWTEEQKFVDKPLFSHLLKYLAHRIPDALKRKTKMIEAFKRKAQTESHDDIIKELKISHGSVTDYVTEIQEKYLGDAGEDARDEELTEQGIPHLTQGKNSDKPDHLIFDSQGNIIEVQSQKTFLDFDLYKATHNVSQSEYATAEANNCPLFIWAYECRGFTWHVLRYTPSEKNGQIVKSNLLSSPHALAQELGVEGPAASPAPRGTPSEAPAVANFAREAGGGQLPEVSISPEPKLKRKYKRRRY